MAKFCIVTNPINEILSKFDSENNFNNKIFLRHKKILNNFSNNIIFYYLQYSVEHMEKNIEDLNFIDKKYLIFLKNAYKNWEEFDKPKDYESILNYGLVSFTFSKKYKILNKLPFYKQTGIFGNDNYTSIFDYTYEYVLKSAYNGIYIAKKLLNEYDVIYSCNIFPGHHATQNSYGGYCFINNASICAIQLLENYDKVAILDLDMHCHDGTQRIFYNCNKVLTVSIHANPTFEFPSYYGYEEEKGKDEGLGFNINYPLNSPVEIEKYLETLNKAMVEINKFEPKILIIAFGGDTFKDDPESLGSTRFNLEINDYKVIGSLIKKYFDKKIIVIQEGGYNIEHIGTIVNNFITGLLYRFQLKIDKNK